MNGSMHVWEKDKLVIEVKEGIDSERVCITFNHKASSLDVFLPIEEAGALSLKIAEYLEERAKKLIQPELERFLAEEK